jgi:hypothetical protein
MKPSVLFAVILAQGIAALPWPNIKDQQSSGEGITSVPLVPDMTTSKRDTTNEQRSQSSH